MKVPMKIFPFFVSAPRSKEFEESQARDSSQKQALHGRQRVIASDFKDSRARGFVHRSLEPQSLACLYL
ncbi:hypothetical protein Tco_0701570 [Tanacetum coccineum]